MLYIFATLYPSAGHMKFESVVITYIPPQQLILEKFASNE